MSCSSAPTACASDKPSRYFPSPSSLLFSLSFHYSSPLPPLLFSHLISPASPPLLSSLLSSLPSPLPLSPLLLSLRPGRGPRAASRAECGRGGESQTAPRTRAAGSEVRAAATRVRARSQTARNQPLLARARGRKCERGADASGAARVARTDASIAEAARALRACGRRAAHSAETAALADSVRSARTGGGERPRAASPRIGEGGL